MSRTRLEIGKAVAATATTSEHMVSVRSGDTKHQARVSFTFVNGKAVWSVGACNDDCFEAVNTALAHRGEKALYRKIKGGS